MYIKPLEDEIVILQRLQAGDEHSFGTIYRHYYASVRMRVERIMHSPQLADDVTQEIFLKIWESRKNWLMCGHSIPTFSSLPVIILSMCLKVPARSEMGMSEIVRHFDKVSNATEDQVQDNEYLRFIKRKLDELPPRTKEIFILCREQSKSYNEVAAALGISRDAVKSRMVHAMKILRNSAEEEMGLPLTVVLALTLL